LKFKIALALGWISSAEKLDSQELKLVTSIQGFHPFLE
jgi:hypothetical protein